MKKEKRLILLIAVLAAAAVIIFLLTQNSQVTGVYSPAPAETETIHTEETAVPTEVSEATEVTETTEPPETTKAPEATEVPEATETPETQDTDPAETAGGQTKEQPFLIQITDDDPSIAYVLVRMPDPIGLLPLPVEGEYTRTIRQTAPDGTEAVNVLHLTPNGFRMEDANCEGHDCVNQGEVTLENRETRILWNMIICLPHQLSLELITREEALQMIGR